MSWIGKAFLGWAILGEKVRAIALEVKSAPKWEKLREKWGEKA
jgi:hypothetical protein